MRFSFVDVAARLPEGRLSTLVAPVVPLVWDQYQLLACQKFHAPHGLP